MSEPTEQPQNKGLEHHRQILQSKLEQDKGQANTYISPSDTIMSPTTKKLSDLKGKRFANGKPQSLFAKAVGNNTKTPSPEKVGGFEDVNKTSPS